MHTNNPSGSAHSCACIHSACVCLRSECAGASVSVRKVLLAVLISVCMIACILAGFMPLSAQADEDRAQSRVQARVLMVLTDSLTWGNINASETPELAKWAESGTMFNIVPPNINGWDCPQDGALSMSAGTVARAYTTGSSPACSLTGMAAGSTMPGWSSLLQGEVENLMATTERLYPSENPSEDKSSENKNNSDQHFDQQLPEQGLQGGQEPELPDYAFTNDQEVLALEAHRLETELPPLGAFGELLSLNNIEYIPIGSAAGALTINSEGLVDEKWVAAQKENVKLAKQVKDSLQSVPVVFVDASSTNFGAYAARAEAMHTKSIKMPPALPIDSEPDTESNAPIEIFLNGYREAQGKANAQRINDVLKEVDPGTLVLMTSTQAMGATSELGPSFISYGMAKAGDLLGHGGLGWSSQVRQQGAVSYLSILPTLMQALDMKVPEGFYGGLYMGSTDLYDNPMKAVHSDSSIEKRSHQLANMAGKASAIRSSRTPFYRVMRGAAIGFTFVSTLALMWILASRFPQLTSARLPQRKNVKAYERIKYRLGVAAQRCFAHMQAACELSHRRDGLPARLRLIVRWTLILGGLAVSAVPLSSHIVTIFFPWWNALSPTYALVGATWLCAGIIGATSMLLLAWDPFAPVVVVSAATAIALLADVATGSRILADSPMGFNTLMGSRFYGMGNEAFALVAVGSLMGIAGVCSLLLRAGCARWLIAVCAGVLGLGVATIDVWPTMGADFGGALSFVPALAVLIVLVSRVRVTAKRVVAVCALGVLAAGGAAVADWLRPEESRTHLGNFVQSIIDGEAWEIIARKISVNIHLLQISAHRWVVASALLFIVCVLVPLLRRWYSSLRESMMLMGMVSTAVALILGWALNDSGITLPGMGCILLIPGMISALAYRWDGERIDYVGALQSCWNRVARIFRCSRESSVSLDLAL